MSLVTESRFVFLDPVHGETVNSWIGRIHHRANFPVKNFFAEIFGALGWRGMLNPAMPTNLLSIAKYCPPGHLFNDSRQIATHNTAAPYFIYFKDEKRRQELLDLAANSDGRRFYHTAFGATTYPIRPFPEQPRFCLECIDEEWEMNGYPIFHVEHQLPGVALCWRHKTKLWMGCKQCGRRHSQSAPIHLPGQCALGHIRSHQPAFEHLPDNDSVLVWIATESAYIWKSTFCFSRSPISLLRQAACDRFPEGNRYSVNKLRERLNSRFGSILNWLESPATKEEKWYRKALSPSTHENGQIGSLRCLLLLGAIFESVHDFEMYAAEVDKPPMLPDRIVNTSDSNSEWAKDLASFLSKNDFRLNRVQRILGISFTEIKQEMIKQRIALPKSGSAFDKIPSSVYSAIVRDLQSGQDKLCVAQRHDVSMYQMELIMLWEPGLQEEWWIAWINLSLDSAKATVLSYRGDPPQRTRGEIRRKYPGRMETIQRHDPDWIPANLPVKPRGLSLHSSQWNRVEYDNEVSQKIEAIAKAELATGRPRFLSVTRLVRESGQWHRFETHQKNLPKIRGALNRVVESREQFHLRRLIWASRQLVLRSKPIGLNILRLTSGLSAKIVEKHFDYVVRHPNVNASIPFDPPLSTLST